MLFLRENDKLHTWSQWHLCSTYRDSPSIRIKGQLLSISWKVTHSQPSSCFLSQPCLCEQASSRFLHVVHVVYPIEHLHMPFLWPGISSCHFSPKELWPILQNQFRHHFWESSWNFQHSTLHFLYHDTCHSTGLSASLTVFVSLTFNLWELGCVHRELAKYILFRTMIWLPLYRQHQTHTVPKM